MGSVQKQLNLPQQPTTTNTHCPRKMSNSGSEGYAATAAHDN